MDKPIAEEPTVVAELLQLAKEKNLLLMAGFNRRCSFGGAVKRAERQALADFAKESDCRCTTAEIRCL